MHSAPGVQCVCCLLQNQAVTTEHAIDPLSIERKWAELAPLIERIMERVGAPREFPVSVGSSLAGDDRASSPYQVSHALMQALVAGVDHLHAAKVLIVDHQVLHLAAPWSLTRGALENLAVAYWILGPVRRSDRVERALRWHYRNIADQHAATDLHGLSPTPLDAHLAKIDAVAGRNGLSGDLLRRGYYSSAVVKYCERELGARVPEGVLLPWQLSSGFAHGQPWAYLGASSREVESTDSEGVVSLRLTSSLTTVLFPMLSAMHLLQEFLRLHGLRAMAP